MSISNLPLVSVIIPFYNEEDFLSEAIDSVRQQTYPHWEIILVDDGSTNHSREIAKGYAAAYPHKITCVEHEGHANKGAAASRNLGVRRAKGELLAFLDSDDVWLPFKLETQVDLLQKHPEVGMVAEASEYWSSWQDPGKQDVLVPIGVSADQVYPPLELARELYPLQAKSCPCPSALVMTREAFDRSGGFEESYINDYQMYEDQAFLSKVYLKENVYVSSACNNRYRQRIGSVEQSAKAKGLYPAARQYFLGWYEHYLTQHNIQDPGLWALLEKAFLPYRHPQEYFLKHTLPLRLRKLLKRGMHKLAVS
ncbi:glycosyltransferase [Nibribacter ruber]|uniref:Glycosyltransferase n=1 Tax=Nibribacter ruber TaxID=2698458 RepID=A0A6P1P3T9_9BACT|nr:glycosyltransferase family A protein [Nibribacter ruber]QHL89099.1 glycosyltransferase [Nibribacter ruber]